MSTVGWPSPLPVASYLALQPGECATVPVCPQSAFHDLQPLRVVHLVMAGSARAQVGHEGLQSRVGVVVSTGAQPSVQNC